MLVPKVAPQVADGGYGGKSRWRKKGMSRLHEIVTVYRFTTP
jgi:hypothetical protein